MLWELQKLDPHGGKPIRFDYQVMAALTNMRLTPERVILRTAASLLDHKCVCSSSKS